MENFIMLPNKIIWNRKDCEDTYLHIYGDKILHIFSYLYGVTNRFGNTIFIIKDMVTTCGYAPKSGKGKINEQFKNILIDLQKKNIIETATDLSKIDINTYISCIFNVPIEKDKNNNNTKFFNIPYDNYLEIMDRYTGKLSKVTLLKVYYYINSRTSRRGTVYADGKKLSNSIEVNGGKAECFYDSYSSITKDIKINENTWCTYIKELNNIGLLYYNNIGIVKKDGVTHMANNVYCISEDEATEALKQSKLFYTTNGYTLLGKNTKNDLRVIKGLKGKIQSEGNKNKDTSKLEIKLEMLENINSKSKKHKHIKIS